jgi:23S rRNA pseudouridine2605 synthase
MSERLQKVLAAEGLGSRREIERWIVAGRLTINGEVASLGAKATLGDVIELDGKRLRLSSKAEQTRVIIYNKPEGEVSTRFDPEGRKTVFDRLPAKKGERWIAVGRLDINTSGLLLFTNDGTLANALMHPSNKIDREYAVRVKGVVEDETLQILREGVLLEDGIARFTDIQRGRNATGSNSWFYVVLMEGKNREVRRLWESQELQVSRLKRVRYGNIFIPSSLKAGKYTELSSAEVASLANLAGLEPVDSNPEKSDPAPRDQSRLAKNKKPSRR